MKTQVSDVLWSAGPHGSASLRSFSEHNGLKTAALLGLLSGLILAVGYWLGGSGGLVFAVIISLVMNGVSYFFSDKIALRAMRARPVSEAEFPALHQIVRELAT